MEKNGIELFCIGNPLIDVFSEVADDFPLRYGLKNEVQHVPVEEQKRILCALKEGGSANFVECSGGGAANAAKIAGLLGIKTAFQGSSGNDEKSLLFEKEMEEAGVSTHLVKKNTETGTCLFLQTRKGLIVSASPSAALELNENDIEEDLIRTSRVVVLDGYMLGREILIRKIFSLADKCGTVIALDLSSVDLASEKAHEIVTFARVYPLILFMNEAEAKAFYRALRQSRNEKAEEEDNEEGLNPDHIALFKTFTANDIFPILAVKLGSKGALVFAHGNIYREVTIPVKTQNTTGAGDAFCAAFLGAWIRDKSLANCASLGNKAARAVLDTHGTETSRKIFKKLGKKLGN